MNRNGLFRRGVCMLLCLVMALSMAGCGEVNVKALEETTIEGEAIQPVEAPEEPAGEPAAQLATDPAAPADPESPATDPAAPADKSVAEETPTDPGKEPGEADEKPEGEPENGPKEEPEEGSVGELEEEPEDTRTDLQRAIEDEAGAYVMLTSRDVYEDGDLTLLMGSMGDGLAFAVEYCEHPDGDDAVQIEFHTTDDELLSGYVYTFDVTVLDRAQTMEMLKDMETYEVMPQLMLPLSSVEYTAEGEIKAEAEDELPLLGAPALRAPESGGVDQALEARLTTTTTNQNVGAAGAVRLNSTFSSTSNTEYATVRLMISGAPGLTFPYFSNDQYEISSASGNLILTLHRDENGEPDYIEYTLHEGDTVNAYLYMTVPNGYSENTTSVTLTPVVVPDADGNPTFTGNSFLSDASVSWKADFQWQPVSIKTTPSSASVAYVGGNYCLGSDLSYTISAMNAKRGLRNGVIFTAEYELMDTITLPDGLSFSGTGEPVLSADGRSVSIDGVTVATFNKAVESVSINRADRTMSFTYRQDNATLDANGNPESGKTAAEISNCSLGMTLIGSALSVDINSFVSGSNVTHDTTFNAYPAKQVAEVQTSTAGVSTPITIPGISFGFSKTNSPANSAIISDTNTFICYTLTVKNNGIIPQTVTVHDAIPANAVYATDASHQPTAGIVTVGTPVTEVKWTPTLQPNEIKTFSFYVKVAENTPNGTVINNRGQLEHSGGQFQDSNSVTNTFDGADHLELKKTAAPWRVEKGTEVTYTIDVTNLSTGKTSDAYVLTDTLQEGLELTDAEFAAVKAAYPSAAYDKATRVMTIQLPQIPANNAANPYTITFKTTVKDEFDNNWPLENTAEIKELAGVKSTATVNFYVKQENLTLDKNTTKTTVKEGEIIPYTIQIRNTGDIAKAHDLTDILPAGTVLADGQLNILRATYPGAAYDAATRRLTIPGVTVPVGQTTSISFQVKVNNGSGYKTDDKITNTARIEDLNLSASVAVKFIEKIDKWTLDKTVSVSTVTVGDTVPYKIVVKNVGEVESSHDITDTLPLGMAPAADVLAANPTWSYNAATRVLTIPAVSLALGESKTFSFNALVTGERPAGASMENVAEVKDLSLRDTAYVYYKSRLNLTKSADRVSVMKNEVVTWTVKATNISKTTPITNETMIDTLPVGMTMTAEQLAALNASLPTGTVATYDAATRKITITGVNVPPDSTIKISFSSTTTGLNADGTNMADNTTLTNVVEMGGVYASASVIYNLKRANVTVGKTNGGAILTGENIYQINYTLRITNQGEKTDGLDEPLTFVDAMSGGLYPIGAGDNTTGTISGTDSHGNTVTGNWVRTGVKGSYVYTTTWDLPVLEKGEVYTIAYKAEVYSDGTVTVYARNSAKVQGSVTSGSVETEVIIKRRNELKKVISKIGASTLPIDTKNSDVFPGQSVTYTLTIKNNGEAASLGTMVDSLPAIRSTSSFRWVYGDNVTVTGLEPDGSTVVGNKLTWSNINLPKGEALSLTVTLHYPLADEFVSAFGSMPNATTNDVAYTSDDGSMKLEDHVSHNLKVQTINFNKSVDKTEFDVATATGTNAQAIYTLSGFDTEYPTRSFSVLDNLDDVRNKFDITAVGFGSFRVVGLDGVDKGYTMTLTFSDGTVLNVPVGTDNVVTVNYPAGKSVANVASIRWGFGDVQSLTINMNPTITTTVKPDAFTGKSLNRMYVAYDNKYESKQTTVNVSNSTALKKSLMHDDGTLVDNDEHKAVTGETLTYQISFTNLVAQSIDLTTMKFSDAIRTAGLDITKDMTVSVSHTSMKGKVPDKAVLTSTTVPASDWADGAFDLTFASGTMDVGDVITLKYDVTVGADFKDSLSDASKGLYNQVAASIIGGDELARAETDVFQAAKQLSLYMQKAAVASGSIVRISSGGCGFYMDSSSMGLEYIKEPTIVTSPAGKYYNYAESPDMAVMFQLSIVNSNSSNVDFRLETKDLMDYLSAVPGHLINYAWAYILTPGSYTYEYGVNMGASGSFGYKTRFWERGSATAIEGLGAGSLELTNISSTDQSLTSLPVYKILKPGQGMEWYVIVCNPFANAVDVTNTFTINAKEGVNYPSGTTLRIADGEMQFAKIDRNSAGAGNPTYTYYGANVGTEPVYDPDTETISSSVDIHLYQGDIGIEKTFVGVVTAEKQQSADYTPVATELIQPTDWLAFDIKCTGIADAMKSFNIVDTIPYPYTFARLEIDGKQYTSGIFGIYCDSNTSQTPDRLTIWGQPSVSQSKDFVNLTAASNIRLWIKPRTGIMPELGSYTNSVIVKEDGYKNITGVSLGEEVLDAGELIGAKANADFFVGGKYGSNAFKTVTNAAGGSATGKTATNYVVVEPTEDFTYTMDIESQSIVENKNLVIIDRLPAEGDGGAVNIQSKRYSKFDVEFAADPDVQVFVRGASSTDPYVPLSRADYIVEFTSKGPSEVFSETDWDGTNTSGWGGSSTGMNALRIRFVNGYVLSPQNAVRVTFKAKISDPDESLYGEKAYNTFGYRYSAYDSEAHHDISIIAEPAKVGVTPEYARMTLNKTSLLTGANLANAEFTVYQKYDPSTGVLSDPVATIKTNTSGVGTSGYLTKNVYYVQETKAPTNYLINSTVFTVDLTGATHGGTVSVNGGQPITDATDPIWVTLKKTFATGATIPTTDITLNISGVFVTGQDTVPVTFTPAEWAAGTGKDVGGLVPNNEYTITENDTTYTFTATGTYDDGVGTLNVTGGVFTPAKDCTVVVTNDTARVGKLQVRKVVDTADGGVDGGETFTIKVSGTFSDGSTEKLVKISRLPVAEEDKESGVLYGVREQYVEIPDVVLNNVYTIDELFAPDTYTVSYSARAVSASTAGVNVTVTNKAKVPVKLLVEKTIDGAAPDAALTDEFTIRVTGAFSNGDTEKTITLNKDNGFSAEIPNVKVNQAYSVQEIGQDVSKYTPSYTGLDINGQVTVTEKTAAVPEVKVTVDNSTVKYGTITVLKQLTSNASNVPETFTFSLVGPTGAGSEDYVGTVTVPAGSTEQTVSWKKGGVDVTLANMKLGEYVLKETSQATNFTFKNFVLNGATSTATNTDGLTFTLGQDQTVGIQVVNEEALGAISVLKRLPADSDITKSFDFTLVGPTGDGAQSYNGTAYMLAGNAMTNVTWKLNGADASMDALPVGEYKITETLPSDHTFNFTSFVVNTDGTEATTPAEAGKPASATFTISGTETQPIEITANNARNTATITVTKEVTGAGGIKTQEFAFTVKLSDTQGNVLSGSYDYVGSAITGVDAPQPGTITLDAEGKGVIHLIHGQSITITVPFGIAYEVTEEDVTASGYEASFEGDDSGLANSAKSVKFINYRPLTVPSGIIMDIWPYALGVAIAVVAIVLLLRSRKKKKSDFSDQEW